MLKTSEVLSRKVAQDAMPAATPAPSEDKGYLLRQALRDRNRSIGLHPNNGIGDPIRQAARTQDLPAAEALFGGPSKAQMDAAQAKAQAKK